ncbi:hypothetical protein [Nocardia otitidiscaviarum]|nr:hypothetical protein [Nocardia otitidiscaviarum]
MTPTFRGGHNIAMKLPRAQFDRTVAFYRDTSAWTSPTTPTNPSPQA